MSESQQRTLRDAYLTITWDQSFTSINGYRVFLLTDSRHSVGTNGSTIASSSPDGKKWVVAKSMKVDGEPVVWCVPIIVEKGQTVNVVLSDDNMMELAELSRSR